MKTEFPFPPTTKLSTACTSMCTLWGLLLMVMKPPTPAPALRTGVPSMSIQGLCSWSWPLTCTITVSILDDPSKWHETLHFLHILKKKTDRKSLLSSYLFPATLLCGFIITPSSQGLFSSPSSLTGGVHHPHLPNVSSQSSCHWHLSSIQHSWFHCQLHTFSHLVWGTLLFSNFSPSCSFSVSLLVGSS